MPNEPAQTPASADLAASTNTPDIASRRSTVGTVVQSPADAARVLAANDSAIPASGYEILGELGRGAMGVVYKARQVQLNRLVALKMILGERLGHEALSRFRVEAEAVASIKHAHVVQVYDFGETDGRPYMALEFLSGATFADRLKQADHNETGFPLTIRATAVLLGKIARGVAAVHAKGIVHRDLKPANILFDESGEPKVSDFGLAKRDGGAEVTLDGAIMGTPAYMSPEQASGQSKSVGPPADVWALGVILYQSLTGERPFSADDTRTLLAQVMTAAPLPLRKRIPAIPRHLELICLKCLAKDPRDRYPTAEALADDLDRFVKGESNRGRLNWLREVRYGWVKRRKFVAVAALFALVAVVAVALVISNRTARPAVYEVGSTERLFDGESPVGWEGQGWAVVKDIEQTTVLEGEGKVTRRLSRLEHFQVTVRLDPYRAHTVELVLASTEGPPESATEWVVRLDRQSGAAFGKRVGPEGEFKPLRAAVPLPTGTENRPPYFQVRYERAGGALAVWLNEQSLGRVTDRKLQALDLRMNAIGGPIRIEAADQAELIELKPRRRP